MQVKKKINRYPKLIIWIFYFINLTLVYAHEVAEVTASVWWKRRIWILLIISAQLCTHWYHVGCLKLVEVEIFTPQKLANATNTPFPTPLQPTYQHTTASGDTSSQSWKVAIAFGELQCPCGSRGKGGGAALCMLV